MPTTVSPDDEYNYDYEEPEVNVPGATISTVVFSIGGLLANLGAFLVIRKKEDLHNSFGLLCLSHVVADLFTSLITLLWCAPCVWFVDPSVWTEPFSWYSNVVCMIAMHFYFVTLYTHVAKAINRLIAISRPVVYRRWITSRGTVVLLAALWVLTFCQCCIFLINGCHVTYDGQYYIWYYEETSCGDRMWIWVDNVLDFALIGMTILCDIVTLLFVRIHRRRVRRAGLIVFVVPSSLTRDSRLSRTSTISTVTKDRFWLDIRFFAQGTLIVVIYASLILIDRFNDEDGPWFSRLFLGSLVYDVSAIVGGIVVVVFNIGLR